jgi:hypothetical protein
MQEFKNITIETGDLNYTQVGYTPCHATPRMHAFGYTGEVHTTPRMHAFGNTGGVRYTQHMHAL